MNPFLPESSQSPLVLASRSPRRVDILRMLGFVFEVDPAGEECENDVVCDDPVELAELLACRKRDDIAARRGDSIVVAADTIVVVDGTVFTKPQDDDHARTFLRRMSGRSHQVVTGVALYNGGTGRRTSGSEMTTVTFRKLSDADIASYVASGEGNDKAGSYAAQGLGASLIERIDGCFYNVVGLPVVLFMNLLQEVGR